MVTIKEYLEVQEYLDKEYPTKEKRAKVEEIYIHGIKDKLKKESIELEPIKEIDLSDYVGLTILDLQLNELISINLTRDTALTTLNLGYNQLTSVDFLNALSYPEKLRSLVVSNNKIHLTKILD
ncbi:leucine-rich repeat domain-containing protein [endosymbiont GvMRE of Glomus versiforme]|uniref:leucine-rich repeat domain-containing protein n=1 Tax=endosymbiont GvMRE of Glomus versiforme TaxID=2039283 RepID=UPI000ED03BEA|nr:leucine-rich repeat domain-containing protein [endosymbiont GvMRE of Glomus versiforme]RHZ35626.1 hypothetical protein GvMRE_IIg255 [endosymbiont GvMRE of Glomus versiforme]